MLKRKERCRACGGDGGGAMNDRLQAALAELLHADKAAIASRSASLRAAAHG